MKYIIYETRTIKLAENGNMKTNTTYSHPFWKLCSHPFNCLSFHILHFDLQT